MSPDLKYLINQGAETVLAFECIKPCRRIGKIILIQYYKSGHSLGVIFIIWLLSLIKLILFYPLLEAVCCSKIRHEQITLLNDEIKKSKSKDNNGNELTSSNTTYDPDLNTNNNNSLSNRKISGNGVTNEYIAKERGAYDDNDDIWNDDNDASNKILMGLDSDGNGFTDIIDFGDDINTNNDDIKTDKKTKIGGAYDD